MLNSYKEIFSRNRFPAEVKAFASRLYARGPTLRKLKGLLQDFGVRASHVAIWKRVQLVGEAVKDELFQKRKRREIVVDETKIRVQDGWIWIFAAIDPENREIVSIPVTRHRESIDALIFLKRCLERCEGKPVLITDGGLWHKRVAQRFGLDHRAASGEERNYVERWYQTLKRRLENFYIYFPPTSKKSIKNFMRVYAHWYNNSRYHMSLKKHQTKKHSMCLPLF